MLEPIDPLLLKVTKSWDMVVFPTDDQKDVFQEVMVYLENTTYKDGPFKTKVLETIRGAQLDYDEFVSNAKRGKYLNVRL